MKNLQHQFLSIIILLLKCIFECKHTPVLMANKNYNINFANTAKAMAVVASMPIVAVPIQDVQLLDYALAHETVNEFYNLLASNDDKTYNGLLNGDPYTSDQQKQRDQYELDEQNWNEVVFEEVYGGSTAKIALHKDWINQQSYQVDAVVNLDLPEQGMAGPFRITSIKHILPQKKPENPDLSDDYDFRPVTALFTHASDQVYTIDFVTDSDQRDGNNGEVLGVTYQHPIYSVTANGWRFAGELVVGEKVLTASGEAAVAKTIKKEGVETVYNLEIKELHNFLVGESGVVVHNTGLCFDATKKLLKDYISHFKVGGKKGIGNKSVGVRKGDKIEVTINSTGEKFDVPIDGKEFPDLTQYTPRSNNGTPLSKDFSTLKGSANRDFDNELTNDWLNNSGFMDEFEEVYFPNGTKSSWVRLKKGNQNLEYTWHHHEDGKTMMLVEQRIHSAVNHVGGASLINSKAVSQIEGYSDIFKNPVFN